MSGLHTDTSITDPAQGFDASAAGEYQRGLISAIPVRTLAQAVAGPIGFLSKLAASAADILAAARQTDTHPTTAQCEAGNYRKGKTAIHGLPVAIENPKGSVRRGTSEDGSKWQTTMAHHYGYFLKTLGRDKDRVDVFIGPDPKCELVFVVNQNKADGKFDEHKILAGFRSEAEARKGYLANYSAGWQGLGSIVPMTVPQFKKWLSSSAAAGPAREVGI